MSRIHDALKQAERDRAAHAAADPQAAPAPVAALKIEAPHNGNGGPAANPAVARAKLLSFEELRVQCAHVVWQPEISTDVFHRAMGSHGAEQFRTLRTRLYQIRSNQPLQTVLVTSAVAGEGKTFLTSNLARAIVRQADRRVLIIDADLRGSHLHVPFGALPTPGLSDYLRGAADDVTVMQFGQDPNLCLIPGGNAVGNPSELLSNGRFKMLLERVAPLFDWVLVDSPPCLPVADAGVLAELCDGLLLVVKANSTPSAVVLKAGQELQNRRVIGVALNAVDEQALAYGSYYRPSYGNDDSGAPETRLQEAQVG